MNNLMVIDGIEVRRDAYGRYSLNDLHRAAVASGANARTKEPGKFLSSQQTVELVHELTNTQNLGVDPVSVIHGGNERGTYVCKELVYAYAMWISPSFHLKVIRTFDMVTSAPEKLKVFKPDTSCAVSSPYSRINRDRSPTGNSFCASVRE